MPVLPRLILFSAIFVFSISAPVQCQIISGVVTSSQNGEVLPFANVFINNSTEGVSTDQYGMFSLTTSSLGPVEVVVSYVGFVTQSKVIEITPGQDSREDFALDPLEKQLTEVEVISKGDKKWEKQLKEFEEVFLGESRDSIAAQTMITNPWVIDFEERKRRKTGKYLYAQSTTPIEIDNEALGYTLSYLLQNFEVSKTGYQYLGKAHFTEKDTTDDRLRLKWQTNRQLAYHGSEIHFLKAMLDRNLGSEGFKMFESLPADAGRPWSGSFLTEIGKSILPLAVDSVKVFKTGIGSFKLVYDGKIEIHFSKEVSRNVYYKDVYYPISWIEFKNDTLEVNADGVPIYPEQLIVSGKMSQERIPYMLPNDYSIQNEVGFLSFVEANRLNSLREKPYLYSDKPYYYTGEYIWFNSRMLYKDFGVMDTLSKVLYVDLIRTDSRLAIQSVMLPMEDGMANGYFKLPGNLNPGDYCLRAYTNWMRNFSEPEYTYLPLPVLSIFAKPAAQKPTDLVNHPEILVSITSEEPVYPHRKPINLEIKLTNGDGSPVLGDMTVSITDTLQVPSLGNFSNLVSAYSWTSSPRKYPNKHGSEYPIEYGISLSGQFVSKGVPEQAFISIVQGNWEDYGIIRTDSSGRLWASGLQFNDTATVSLAGLDPRTNGSFGTFLLDDKTSPGIAKDLPVRKLQLKRQTTLQREYNLNFGNDYTLLPEIEVKGKKVDLSLKDNFGYPQGDRIVSRDRLAKYPQMQAGALIGMLVPGASPDGTRVMPAIFQAPLPLLVVDGIPQLTFDKTELREVLQSFYAYDLESINVYTTTRHLFGLRAAGGVIALKTRGVTDHAIVKVDRFLSKEGYNDYVVEGYQKPLEFPSPDYSLSKESYSDPDFRSTLYWSPNLKTNNDGIATVSFYSGDLDTVYRVLVEGFTEDHIPFRFVKYLSVKQ